MLTSFANEPPYRREAPKDLPHGRVDAMKPLRVASTVIATVMIAIGIMIGNVPSNKSFLIKSALAMTPSNPPPFEIRPKQSSQEAAISSPSNIPISIPVTGAELDLNTEPGSAAHTVAVDDGVRINTELTEKPVSGTVVTTTTWIDEARELDIVGSLHASLDQTDVPAEFAMEIARLLRETYDVRRDLRGGERLQILWSRRVLGDGSPVGWPRLSYVALDTTKARLEIVWTYEDHAQTTLYVDEEVARSLVLPARGGRLSSAFGPRMRPINAAMSLHTGVDISAALGAPIVATASGYVSYIGWRSGYGRVVEVSHNSDIITRYAHLNAVTESLALGDRVSTGTVIGEVGESGPTTSPYLHYEVRVADQPVDPLGAIDWPSDTGVQDAAARLAESRSQFAATLGGIGPGR